MSTRPGFTIPNAGDVGNNTDIAEPDSGDFTILGNHRNGVITGCGYSFDGNTGIFTIIDSVNLVLLDGSPSSISTSLSIAVSGAGPKFVLVCWQGGTNLTLIQGTGGPNNPVFPDIPAATVVLASVFIPEDSSELVCTDKRLFLANGNHSYSTSGNFLTHRDASGVNFSVESDGTVRWGTGSAPSISKNVNILETSAPLTVDGDLTADSVITGDVEASGIVTSSNIQRGSGNPSSLGTPGDIYQSTTGKLFARDAVEWVEVIPAPTPVGTVITNVAGPADPDLIARGWLPLNGTSYNRSSYPDLWDVIPASWKSVDNTKINLPNMASRTLMGTSSTGSPGALGGQNSVNISVPQLPSHRHIASSATATTSDGGQHRHDGVDGYTGGGFVFTNLAGTSKLYSFVENATTTASVSFGEVGINGRTDLKGSHNHTVNVGALESNVGSGQPVDTTPAHMSIYYYIKA